MKRLLIATLLLIGFTALSYSQNRQIEFEQTKNWNELVAKAKGENKLIFVDCYTDWCGPCKMLAANVFTQDAVADFYNANFVNAKLEMEKDADGIAHKDTWEIKAYPTMVFVDPNTGDVVHRLVGSGKAEWIIDGGKAAMDPSRNMNGMIARYNRGDRDPQFIASYLAALKAGYMSEEQGKVASAFLDGLSPDQLATPDNWLLIRDNINDPMAKPMQAVVANRQKFYNIEGVGQEVVDRQISSLFMGKAMGYSYWQPGRGDFDKEGFDAYNKYLSTLNLPAAKQARAWMDATTLRHNNDWKGLLKEMRKVEKNKVFENSRQFATYFQRNIESFGSADEKNMTEAIKWIDKQIADNKAETSDAFFQKAALAGSKERIYKAAGNSLAADNAKLERENYEKEGTAASGGRMAPAMRMN